MSHKIYFTLAVCRPEINSQDEEGGINITVGTEKSISPREFPNMASFSRFITHLISISFKVEASFTTSRTHGGGVMGRLSCGEFAHVSSYVFSACISFQLALSPKPHIRARIGC